MKTLKTIYYHINGTQKADERGIGDTSENYVKAEVYYSEGGYSYFTYKNTPRAYFMSAHTVGRGKDSCGYWESHSICSPNGAKEMIGNPVARQSKKKADEAQAYFDANVDEFVAKIFPNLVLEKEMVVA